MSSHLDIRVAIVIVNWNTRDFLRSALQSIAAFAPSCKYRVVVVDNASADGSADMVKLDFSQIELVSEKHNQGFARAMNRGMQKIRAPYYLLLNSDCEFIENILDKMISYMEEHPKLGILGPAVVYPDGSLQSAGEPPLTVWSIFKSQILFSKSPLRMRRAQWPENGFQEVGFVSGSCMLIRGALSDAIGYLREDFFMYGEDVDYCLRASRAGWKVGVLTGLRVRHYKAKSTTQNLSATLKNSILNNCQLILENSGSVHALFSLLFYAAGAAMRGMIAFISLKPNSYEWFKLCKSVPGLGVKIFSRKK